MESTPNAASLENNSSFSSDSESEMQKKPSTSTRKATGKVASKKTCGAAVILEPSPYDVVFGRGQPFHSHPGNRRMKQLITDNKERYRETKKEDKKEIIDFILDSIRNNGAESGRFLKKTAKGADSPWCEATEKEAYKKVSHSLREKDIFTKPKKPRKRTKTTTSAIAKAQLKRTGSSESDDSLGMFRTMDPLSIESMNLPPSPPLEFPEPLQDLSGGASLFPYFNQDTSANRANLAVDRSDANGAASIMNNTAPMDPMSVDAEPEWSNTDAMLLGPLLKNCFGSAPGGDQNHGSNNNNNNYGSSRGPENMYHFHHNMAPYRQQLMFTATADDATSPSLFPILPVGRSPPGYVSESDAEKSSTHGDDESSENSVVVVASAPTADVEAELAALFDSAADNDVFSFCEDMQFDDLDQQ